MGILNFSPIAVALGFEKACVASAHPIASNIGAAIMRNGGNAFDAAVATRVVQQHQCEQPDRFGLVGHECHQRSREADRLRAESFAQEIGVHVRRQNWDDGHVRLRPQLASKADRRVCCKR